MMNELLLVAVPILPLLLAVISFWGRSIFALVSAPLLAFVTALTLPVDSGVSLPWLLLGVHWQLDAIGQMFMLFSALAWLAAALFVNADQRKRTRSRAFQALFLTAMAGNLLLIVAADMISFYIGFALMGLSAYGLLLKRSQRSRRAARVYLGFTLAGEFALFSALLLVASSSGTLLFSELEMQSIPGVAIALLLIGFGIKVALPGLHPWLPLVYSSAPLVSVAVLSGPMMKAGLLGWIRFLPVGQSAQVDWGEWLMLYGLLGLLMGSVLALLQKRPSAILAYSSVAKMGLMSLLFGYAMANPQHAQVTLMALVLFTMHHLLIKSALFLGLHQYQRSNAQPTLYAGLALLALSLAGLPWSGGAASKFALEQAVGADLAGVLLLAGVAGAVMMLHFLYRLWYLPHRGAVLDSTPWRKLAGMSWWLLLPIAWWAPFFPNQIAFEIKNLLVIGLSAALLLLLHRFVPGSMRLPAWLLPGDAYHLLRHLRWHSPLAFRQHTSAPNAESTLTPFTQSPPTGGSMALIKPGLIWLLVIAVLFYALFRPFI